LGVDIRLAGADDVGALLVMGAAMREESALFKQRDFLPSKAAAVIAQLVAQGGALVADLDGKIVGMLGFVVTSHLWGADLVACDVGFYVAPAHRGGSIAPRLVRAYERAARARGAVEAGLGESSGLDSARTVRLIERMGYSVTSTGATKRL